MMDFSMLFWTVAGLMAMSTFRLGFSDETEGSQEEPNEEDSEDSHEEEDRPITQDDIDAAVEETNAQQAGVESEPEPDDEADDGDSEDADEEGDQDTEPENEYDAEYQKLMSEDGDEPEETSSSPSVNEQQSTVAKRHGVTDSQIDQLLQQGAYAAQELQKLKGQDGKQPGLSQPDQLEYDPEEPMTLAQFNAYTARVKSDMATQFDQMQANITQKQHQASLEAHLDSQLDSYMITSGKDSMLRYAARAQVVKSVADIPIQNLTQTDIDKAVRKAAKKAHVESGRSQLKKAAKLVKKVQRKRASAEISESPEPNDDGGITEDQERQADRNWLEKAFSGKK